MPTSHAYIAKIIFKLMLINLLHKTKLLFKVVFQIVWIVCSHKPQTFHLTYDRFSGELNEWANKIFRTIIFRTGAEEMAPWLRMHSALAEDLCSGPSATSGSS